MRRLVIDTNIYIDWFNAGRHEDILFQREAVKHLSALVLMELRAGAFALRDRRLVQRVESSSLALSPGRSAGRCAAGCVARGGAAPYQCAAYRIRARRRRVGRRARHVGGDAAGAGRGHA